MFPASTSSSSIYVCPWTFSSRLPYAVNNLIYETVNALDTLYEIRRDAQAQKEHYATSLLVGSIAEMLAK